MSGEIILYDLPSRPPCRTWSPNPWKTRLLLNYKQLPYSTVWIEYPDLKPTFSGFGLPPNDPAKVPFEYTSPTVRLPSGEYVMESTAIAKRIEALYPDRPVHLDSPIVARVMEAQVKAAGQLGPVLLPRVPALLLNKASQQYVVPDREKRFGMSLAQYEREKGGAAAYEAAKPYVQALADMLRENDKGPFFLGKEVSYADFIVVGWLHFLERLNALEDVIKLDPEPFRALSAAAAPWLKRDDH